jgi:c-di-AMP phosphodiesterase-like protein
MNRLVFFLLIAFLGHSNTSFASITQFQVQNNDTIQQGMNDSISSLMSFQSDFISNNEIEHQKLLRNIFIAGFLLILGLLIFTILFYGGKIKKVSKIILLQNDSVQSVKDQLVKMINIFNYIDAYIIITDSKGNIEWINSYTSKEFSDDYHSLKLNLINKFKTESQGLVFQGINSDKAVLFSDNLFGNDNQWKMIPIKNSKGEFSNMVFVAI